MRSALVGTEKKKAKVPRNEGLAQLDGAVSGADSGRDGPLAAGGPGPSAGGPGPVGFRDLVLDAAPGTGRKKQRNIDTTEERDIFEESVDNDQMEMDEM